LASITHAVSPSYCPRARRTTRAKGRKAAAVRRARARHQPGSEAERIQQTIDKTVEFFEAWAFPTPLRLRAGEEVILDRRNLTANRRLRMGEKLDITPDEAGKNPNPRPCIAPRDEA